MSGIFGVVSKNNCNDDLYYGTDYHSHLGTQFAGLAVFGKDIQRKIHDIRGSQFKAKFYEDYQKMPGKMGIGVISSKDEQPITMSSKFGPFAIITNGFIDNADKLAKKIYKQGRSFSEVADGNMLISGKVPAGIKSVSINGYTLKEFNPGGTRFSYKIRRDIGTLLEGKNI